MKKSIPALTAIGVLLILLTHPKTAFEGASQGLLLWSQTVLPTLLPFMICSNVIVMLDGIALLTAPFHFLLLHLFHLSEAGSYVLISGLLCGYPMGAKTCSEFLDQGRIRLKEARYLLAFSNHPSPMFLLGYAASALCPQVPVLWLLISLYLPILPLSFWARTYYYNDSLMSSSSITVPLSQKQPASRRSFDDMMMGSVEVMVRIGGYIMLFSILAVFIRQIPGMPGGLKAMFLGIVEITTGIQAIGKTISGYLQGFCLTAVIAFGGLSGVFQTKSVLKNAGLSIRHYILWKLVHTACSCLTYLALAVLANLP